MPWQAADYRFMSRALSLARRGRYSTHPNPRVGCVLVRDKAIVGEGWHLRTGGPHAEINALENAAGSARGTRCYVTLEPCNHQGRTGPCTQALIGAGVTGVVAAMEDPNPAVAGQGLARLAQAGIETACGLMQESAIKLNPGFIMRVSLKRPYVRCKMATSLDGRTAMADGRSRWITSAPARKDVQRLRAASAAIMTGIGTVLADDPGLDVREVDTGGREVMRVVLDRRLRLPPGAKMLTRPGRTLIFTHSTDSAAAGCIAAAGGEVIVLQKEDFPGSVLHYLAEQEEVNEVLLESGPTLAGAMLAAGLVDELILYQAPVLMGDRAMGLFHLPAVNTMEDRVQLTLVDSRMVGQDRRMTYVTKNEK